MQIFIKSLTGDTISLTVDPSDTIQSIKQKVYEKEDISPEFQKCIFNGRLLQDNMILSDYNIQNLSTIHLVTRVLFM